MKTEPKGFLPVKVEELASILGKGKYNQEDPDATGTASVPPVEKQAEASPPRSEPLPQPEPVAPSASPAPVQAPAPSAASQGRFSEQDYMEVSLPKLQEWKEEVTATPAAIVPPPKPKPTAVPQPTPKPPTSFFGAISSFFASWFPPPPQAKSAVIKKPVIQPALTTPQSGLGAVRPSSTMPVAVPPPKGIKAVSKEYYQNGYTDTKGTIQKFKEKDVDDYTKNALGGSTDSLYKSGCLITAVTRIINAITGGNKDPGDVNELAKNSGLFNKRDQGALANIEKLVESGTSKDVKYTKLSGNEASLKSSVQYYSSRPGTCFLIAQLSNGHFVNVNGLDLSGNPLIADTSIKNLSWSDMKNQNLKMTDLRVIMY